MAKYKVLFNDELEDEVFDTEEVGCSALFMKIHGGNFLQESLCFS